MLALGVILRHRRGTRFDAHVLRVLHADVTGPWVQRTLDASDPAISLILVAAVFVAALLARRVRLAVVAVAAPALASGLTQFVLKPWVDRPYGLVAQPTVSLAYPSGHETLVASAAVVAMVALCHFVGRVGRVVGATVLTLWTLTAGVGLVVNFWHYTTDVIGAIGLSAAVVLGAALLADRVSSPAARARPRTTHAA